MNRRPSGDLRSLLVECVKGQHRAVAVPEIADRSSRVAPADLVRAAVAHRVAGHVYRSLEGRASTEVVSRLEVEYARSLAAHLRALADAKVAGDILDGAGIPWLVVKGPVLAELYYADPGLRAYFDLDLVVKVADMRRAINALEEGRCEFLDKGWVFDQHRQSAEVGLVLPYGTRGDLHWHLLNNSQVRGAINLPMAEMFERARRVEIGPGFAVSTLDPEDTFIHLALHAMESGANRLVWMKDIEQAVLLGLDWGVVAERVGLAGAKLVVDTMMYETHRILGTPLPGGAPPPEFAARVWSRAVQLSEHCSDLDVLGGPALNRMVVRSLRRGIPSSVRQLLRNCRSAVTKRVGRRILRGSSTRLDEWREVPLPSGEAGRTIRAAYCDAVERLAEAG